MWKTNLIAFPISENKASKYFDLIHYDILGGYHVKSLCATSYFLSKLDDAS